MARTINEWGVEVEDATPPPPQQSYVAPPDLGTVDKPYTAPPDYGTPPPVKEGADPAPGTQAPEPSHVDPYPKQPSKGTAGGSTAEDVVKKIEDLGTEEIRLRKEFYSQVAPMYRAIQQKLLEPMQAQPQVPNYAPPPDFQENRRQLGKAALGYLAVALPLAVAMGSKGGWAFAGAMGGLGQGIKEVVNGYNDQADRSFQQWRSIGDASRQKFQDQMEVYKSVLASRNMSIGQMTDMISATSKMYGDQQLALAADQQKYMGLLDILSKREEAARRYDEQHLRVELAIAQILGRHKEDSPQAIWRTILEDRATRNKTSVEQEQKKYPFETFLDQWYQAKKGAQALPGQPQTGFPQPRQMSAEDQAAIDDAFGTVRQYSTAPGGSSE